MIQTTILTPGRRGLIANLRSVDTFCNQTLLIAMCRSAADDIERLVEMLGEAEARHRIELQGAADNRFYDQRDAYFEGLADGKFFHRWR